MPIDQSQGGDGFIADLRARRKPRLFVISGPSGVGKDSIIEHLRTLSAIHFAVTATTRPRRPGEIDGIHYYFLDEKTFVGRESEHEFVETALVYNYPVQHAPHACPRRPFPRSGCGDQG